MGTNKLMVLSCCDIFFLSFDTTRSQLQRSRGSFKQPVILKAFLQGASEVDHPAPCASRFTAGKVHAILPRSSQAPTCQCQRENRETIRAELQCELGERSCTFILLATRNEFRHLRRQSPVMLVQKASALRPSLHI